MNKLRAGIIGLAGCGVSVLTELGHNESFTVQAVADENKELAQECAQRYEAKWYDDFRSLIVEEKLDVLFLTLPSYLCGECIQLAAKASLHVFKEAPLARSLPEAMQWLERMDKSNRRFHIGSRKRFAPGYLKAHKLLKEERIGQIYLVRSETFLNYPDQFGEFGWRGDPVLAGGGVLLEGAYHMIDQVVWNFGPPERLYSLNTNQCSKRVLPPYRTEDTAMVTMRFPNGSMGNLLCGWMTAPASERLIMHGTQGYMEAQVNLLRIYDTNGKIIEEQTWQVDDSWLIAQQLRQFADSLLDPDVKPFSKASEHLVNVAIIESAYLSGRTQLPESLKVYGSLFDI